MEHLLPKISFELTKPITTLLRIHGTSFFKKKKKSDLRQLLKSDLKQTLLLMEFIAIKMACFFREASSTILMMSAKQRYITFEKYTNHSQLISSRDNCIQGNTFLFEYYLGKICIHKYASFSFTAFWNSCLVLDC